MFYKSRKILSGIIYGFLHGKKRCCKKKTVGRQQIGEIGNMHMIHLLTVSAALHLFVMLVGCNSMKQVINSDHDVPEQPVSFASVRERKSLTLLLHLLIHPLTSISQFSCSTLKNTVFSNCPSSCRIGKLGISRHRVNSISRGFSSD